MSVSVKSPPKVTAKSIQSAAKTKKTPPAPAALLEKMIKPAKALKVEKIAKLKKPKLVRDSFTIPKSEYEQLGQLKDRAVKLKHAVKKSEILRAGLMLLSKLSDAHLLAAFKNVPTLKTGRPPAASSSHSG